MKEDGTAPVKKENSISGEEKFRKLFEQASDFIMITDFEGNFIDANESLCQTFGYTKEELLQLNIRNLIDADQLKMSPIRFDRLSNGDQIFSERLMVFKNGKKIQVEANVKKVDDNQVIAIARDITERKKAEEIIQKSEANLRSIFDNTDTSYVLVDNELKIVTLNAIARERSQQLYSEPLREGDYLVGRMPESRREVVLEHLQKVLKGESRKYEVVYPMKDGTKKFFQAVENPIRGADGKILGICIASTDITERKVAEEFIQHSEANLRSIFDSTDTSYVLVDKDLKIITMNSIAHERTKIIYGNYFEPGRNVLDYVPQERIEQSKVHLGGVLKGNIIEYESELKLTDGSFRCFHIKEYPIRNKEGEVIGICISGNDITSQKITETDLKEAEIKFRNLVENSQVGVYIMQDGKFAYVNPVFAEIYGYTQQELINTFPAESWVYEADRKIVVEKNFVRLHGEKESDHYEVRGVRKDGKVIWMEVFGSRTLYKGTPAIIGTLMDITERKSAEKILIRSEEKYRLLFESNPLPMWMITVPELAIIDVNDSAVRHYGYSREEFLSMNQRDLRPEEDRQKFIDAATRNMKGINNHGVWKHCKKNGEIIEVEIVTHDLVYEGKSTRLVHGNDVTEKLRAEVELQQMNEQLRQFSAHLQEVREEERKNIAREIHDELGQLLTGIKMDAAWISKKLEPEQKNLLRRTEQMLQLTNNTIESVRRIASELRPGILDDLGLEEAILWQANEFQNKSGIICLTEGSLGDRRFSPVVSIVAFRILQESLTNILRHSRAKTVTVKMNVPNEKLCIEIKDDGKGIEQKKKGKSLGIMGMKERAAMVHGTLDILSAAGEGTTVKVCIPLKPNHK